jgi:hypothetical protein
MKSTKNLYVVNGQHMRLGRFIMRRSLENSDHLVVDHKDHNPLNNRKENLRVCTKAQNAQNRRALSGVVGYKGVWYEKSLKKYRSCIVINGRTVHLGRYDVPEEAALAYNEAAKEHFGEFAWLNDV